MSVICFHHITTQMFCLSALKRTTDSVMRKAKREKREAWV